MKENKKVLYGLIAIALLLSVVGISVGFASMASELTINGTTEVTPATWKIKFKDLSSPIISGNGEVTMAPSITSDTHIGNYNVKLTRPGDSVTYTFNVENSGSIDAELGTFTIANPTITGTGDAAEADATIVKNNLVYTLTYDDGKAVSVNDELKKGESKTLKLTVAYKSDATELPADAVTIAGMDVVFVYGQK